MKRSLSNIVAVIFLIVVGTRAFAQVTITESHFQNLKTVVIENDTVKLEVLPERGANIISIYDKTAHRQWVWQNPRYQYKKPKYNDSFLDYDMSGYDDCFPTVGKEKCLVSPWKDVLLPDHGEVWSLPWSYRIEGTKSVIFNVQGVRFAYGLEKQISLDEKSSAITLRYRVTNMGPTALPMLWGGHYMTAIKPGMKAFFPNDVTFRSDIKPWALEYHDRLAWLTYGEKETKRVAKFFTGKLSQGFAGFYDPKTKDYFLYTFTVEKMPYLGIWINQNGFPTKGSGYYHAGLEPTNGLETPTDSYKAGLLRFLKPNTQMEWQIRITTGKAEAKSLYDEIRAVSVHKIK